MNRTALPNPLRLVFAGGGTGGHFYPALAIANRIAGKLEGSVGVEIHFVGTRRGIEYRLRDQIGYPLHIINVRGLARSLSLKNLLVPFILIGALMSSARLLKEIRPHAVIGTGGYVSWPVIRKAAAQHIPIVLQEQNSFPGMTTRKMAAYARVIYLGFDGARAYLNTPTTITTTGNPVRMKLASVDGTDARRHFGLEDNRRTIAVIGGSQGSRPINNAILASLSQNHLPDDVQLLWQTGRLDHDAIKARLGSGADRVVAFPFTDRMDYVYAAADLAIARAGALTIAELATCRLPALLVPYPLAAGDHQRKNAEEYAESGAAVVVPQDSLAGHDVLALAVDALTSGRADTMREAIEAHQRAIPAVDVIAEGILDIVKQTAGNGGPSDNRNSTA